MNSEPMQTDDNQGPQPSVQNGRKSVSFPGSSPLGDNQTLQSPTNAKILSRKPTPFNADLAASIQNSDLSEFMKQTDETMEQPEYANGQHQETIQQDPMQDSDGLQDNSTAASSKPTE